MCGKVGPVVMHHARNLNHLKGDTEWEKLMLAKHRKTLVVCTSCNAKNTEPCRIKSCYQWRAVCVETCKYGLGGRYEETYCRKAARRLVPSLRAGKGGNIIALAQELYASDDLRCLLEKIAEQAPHVRPVSFSFGQQSSSQPSFQQLEVRDLVHPALLRYLQGRGINIELAKENARNSISRTTANLTSPSASRM